MSVSFKNHISEIEKEILTCDLNSECKVELKNFFQPDSLRTIPVYTICDTTFIHQYLTENAIKILDLSEGSNVDQYVNLILLNYHLALHYVKNKWEHNDELPELATFFQLTKRVMPNLDNSTLYNLTISVVVFMLANQVSSDTLLTMIH